MSPGHGDTVARTLAGDRRGQTTTRLAPHPVRSIDVHTSIPRKWWSDTSSKQASNVPSILRRLGNRLDWGSTGRRALSRGSPERRGSAARRPRRRARAYHAIEDNNGVQLEQRAEMNCHRSALTGQDGFAQLGSGRLGMGQPLPCRCPARQPPLKRTRAGGQRREPLMRGGRL